MTLSTSQLSTESKTGLRIYQEICHAKARLEPGAPYVAIYGGSRITEADPYYALAENLARCLSRHGLSVMSGGGPGIMEAANKGAQHGPAMSVGLTIVLDHEPEPNGFQDLGVSFQHFAARKTVFCQYAAAFIVMPGGFGTLDELFEVLTLIQTRKSREVPVILVGSEFWQGLVQWMTTVLTERKLISADDVRLFSVEDDMEAIAARCLESAQAWRARENLSPLVA